ncbi:hypothetical protein TrVFT333_011142 [Trichoderma virens FT-333]|nr:hypothetical protein TrVFT333_011142 [Trichoderma virens FT-333]
MDDLFSPYWTCPMPECEDNEIGWPTEEELDRHIAEKHSNTSDMFECLFKPCSYKSKLKSNYIQHLKSAHGWKEKASATNNSSGSIYNTPMSVDSALRNHLNAGRLQSRTDTLDYRSGNQSGRASRTVPAIGYFNELYDDYEEEQTQKVARSRLYAEVERPSHKWLEGAGINKSFGGSYKESPIPSRQSRKAAPQPSHRRSEGFVDQQPFDEDDFLGDDELEVAPYQRRTAINRPRPSSSVPYNQHDYNIVPAGNQDHGSSIYRPGLGEFGGIGFKENDKYFNTLQYQEYTSGRPPMPLTAEALRKASKREEPASNSRSTTSSSTGSHKESDYNKNSNTTGLTIQSSAAHNDDFTIKVSGLAVVKVPGTHIEGDGGEITFTSNRGAAAFGGQSHLLNEDQERKITYDPLLAHEDQEYAPYDPSLAASNFY